MKVAFLGAGIMGSAMASNILKGGHSVTIYNRTIEKARPLEKLGAKLATTPKEAVRGAEVVMSMLTNDEACRVTWAGAKGALTGEIAPGAVLIEASTVSNKWVKELAELAKGRGYSFMDCCVAGRPDVAEAGKLAVFAGGDEADLRKVRPVLECIGKTITHFGPIGSGNAFKLIYNVMGAAQVAALAEAMFAAEAAGLDLKAAAKGFSDGATGSPHVTRHARYMAWGEHENPIQFSGANRVKDIDYGSTFIEDIGAQAVIGRAAQSVFEQMKKVSMGDLNDSELIDTLRIEHGRSAAKKS